jgi:hypothetical protein
LKKTLHITRSTLAWIALSQVSASHETLGWDLGEGEARAIGRRGREREESTVVVSLCHVVKGGGRSGRHTKKRWGPPVRIHMTGVDRTRERQNHGEVDYL